ncbi:hypothetical protein A2767_04185 [Candidatus Roizmanbacteria bacterium RIFCSPHIGHO2_01_FULL_35_10]|uniref:Secondary thiamine-phosphate synthase enzyme n=1 Tax=Candidatus Roizmanbacteria bacterium RIFCSPLOWO2_01_FULL_35_13 TaxID=1802055 RepID=A0A1F7IA94_9BACT|nr:MAG: hypothetical protein A2767_04185 [Candidatus Roizmanbacteria bacterium RIFCSPHIGHO2_01_FULL_35_10]OGK40276.1 MAG: hypothetical protein A3A74_07260 [Candidatus Roizmanbacteria bacterium RIFCSPLOWO2_01_FULL_35_13]
MEKLIINTKKEKELVDITDEINEIIKKNKFKEGLITLFLTHTTAALTTIDEDPGVDEDLFMALEKVVPKLNYHHPHNPEHMPSHILSSLIGTSLTLLVENGVLILGQWQLVVLVELDGPKERNIIISF